MPELSPEVRAAMGRLVTDGMTIADKVRALYAAGYQKADIARFVERRYQQVYNVLDGPSRSGLSEGPAAPVPAAEEEENARDGGEPAATAASEHPAKWHWVEIRAGGRVDLPRDVLDALGARTGDRIQFSIDGNGVVTVRNRSAALKALQEEVARYVPEDVDLAAELIAERRTEAAREQGNG